MTGASIVDIKRFAVHDGPGIRTTVFLKGCPLSCKWCHNPESISINPELGLLARKCVSCAECANVCPNGCHSFTNGRHIVDRSKCNGCGKCISACLRDALVLYGRRMSLDRILDAVLEDRVFYEYSGGGVTVSGGEPLVQTDFCEAFFRQLQQRGIHCALDTCGYASWGEFEKMLPVTDLFLYDIKHINPREHEIATGVSNELILENLQKLSVCGKPIEITMPVIPGINASASNIERTGQFLSRLKNIVNVKLLPYHLFARSKYSAVGHIDAMPDVPMPDKASIHQAAEILRSRGIRVAGNMYS